MAESKTGTKKLFVGAFAHSKSLQELDICQDGLIGVDETGRIAFIERGTSDVEAALKAHSWDCAEIVRIKDNGFFFPGFIGQWYPMDLRTIPDLLQIPISMRRSTPTRESSASPPCWTG